MSIRLAPLLTAAAPFLLLPALLSVMGNAAAGPFASFVAALALMVVAAQLTHGIARLPVLWLGGIGAVGAALMPLLAFDLGWPGAGAVAAAIPLGLVAGGLLWLAARRLVGTALTAFSMALLLCLCVLPAITADSDAVLPSIDADRTLLILAGALTVMLVLAWRLAGCAAVRLREAAVESGVPPSVLGFDESALAATACMLAGGLAAGGGALMALGPAPLTGVEPESWVALSLALFVIGRLGGPRLGGALLAALPVAVLPKFVVVLAPGFVDLTLAVTIVALVLHLVVRRDGSPVWREQPSPPPPAGLVAARSSET